MRPPGGLSTEEPVYPRASGGRERPRRPHEANRDYRPARVGGNLLSCSPPQTPEAPAGPQALHRTRLRVSDLRTGAQKWPSCECFSRGRGRSTQVLCIHPDYDLLFQCQNIHYVLDISAKSGNLTHTKATSAQPFANHSHEGHFCAFGPQKRPGPHCEVPAYGQKNCC